jgi:uncharacterized membrane protein
MSENEREVSEQLGAPPRPRRLDELMASYDAASEGLDGIRQHRRAFSNALLGGLDGTLGFLQQHWLAIVNGVVGTFIGIAVLAPLGYAVGLSGVSDAIFNAYRIFCAQTPSHSLYVGGYQMCLCSRCLAIYSSVLLGGVLLALVRGRRDVRALDWRLWIVAMLPMALDGGTQLFGWRESNLGLRLLTGCIFGFATAWFMLPQIERAAVPAEVAARSFPSHDARKGSDTPRLKAGGL